MIIPLRKEGLHAAIATLGDVMGSAGYDNSCYSCHNLKSIPEPAVTSINKYGVP